MALAARDGTELTGSGRTGAVRGLQPSIFEHGCDVEADELVITSLRVARPLSGDPSFEPLLAGARAAGDTVLHGTRTRVPDCEAPEWDRARHVDLPRLPVSMGATWEATGPPIPSGGAGPGPDPIACLAAGVEVLVSRSAAAAGRLSGALPLLHRPPEDLGGPAAMAEVFLVAAGSGSLALTGDCLPG